MKLEDIARHWEEAGQNFPTEGTISPTSRDPYLGILEEENIFPYLAGQGQAHALEIGCGDAAHSVLYAKRLKHLTGIDVAQSLIQQAGKRVAEHCLENVDLQVCSVLELTQRFQPSTFDLVISQRCLINLPDWETQQEALRQVGALLKPGGLFLMTEGFTEELNAINQARLSMDLSEIKVVDYNRNFLRAEFDPFIAQEFEVMQIHDYGFYLFMSRVYHPAVVAPEAPRHDGQLNAVAMEISRKVKDLPDFKPYSYNLLYALRKRTGP